MAFDDSGFDDSGLDDFLGGLFGVRMNAPLWLSDHLSASVSIRQDDACLLCRDHLINLRDAPTG